jgi:hypothetical protein
MTIPEKGQAIRSDGVDSSLAPFSVDWAASDRRKARLVSYLTTKVWSPHDGVVCTSALSCRSSAERFGAGFYEAQGHMVGRCYDLHVDGNQTAGSGGCR